MTYLLPSLNALRGFEAAAHNLNYRLAAEELGVTLFVRLPHRIVLSCRRRLAKCRQTSALVADLESLLLDGTDRDRE